MPRPSLLASQISYGFYRVVTSGSSSIQHTTI